MTATTVEPLDRAPAHAATRPAPAPIPFVRLLKVELVKMFDTRAGFWLMMSMAGAALIATV